MSLDEDDSIFEQALRADLPSAEQQARMRQRLLATGLVAGSALAASNAASGTPLSFGASMGAKWSALSWPAKFGLAAVLAVPVVAVPLRLGLTSGSVQEQAPVPTLSMGSGAQAAVNRPVARPELPVVAVAPAAEPAVEVASASAAARVVSPVPVLAASREVVPPRREPTRSASATSDRLAPLRTVGPEGPAVASFATVHGNSADPARARAASTLAAETRLLDQAFAELAAGNRAAAAALIAEHERQFPNGLLRQERERARTRLNQDPKGE